MQVQANDSGALHASHASFSADEARLVTAGDDGIHVWDVATGKVTTSLIQGPEPSIHAISFVPDDTVVICSDLWVRRYELSGKIHSTLTDSDACYNCSVSRDGQRVAVIDARDIVVYDLAADEPKRIRMASATTLAFSPDGEALAVGSCDGVVSMIDVSDGSIRWSVSAPGRNRWPWTIPALFLVIWGITAWRFWKKRVSVGETPP
jgi:WD40 repeat protein